MLRQRDHQLGYQVQGRRHVRGFVGLHRLAQTRACVPGPARPGPAPCAVSDAVSRLAKYPVEACTSALVRYHGGGAMHYEEMGDVARPSWWPLTTHFGTAMRRTV